MSWTVETLNKAVDKELRALPLAHRQKFLRIVDLLEENGPYRLAGTPYVAPIAGMWEMSPPNEASAAPFSWRSGTTGS